MAYPNVERSPLKSSFESKGIRIDHIVSSIEVVVISSSVSVVAYLHCKEIAKIILTIV